MAKKVILKDLDNVEILPITRGELIVDSSGKEAFHSNEFLATNSLPGLMSAEDKAKLDNIENISGEDKKVEQVNTTTNDSYRLLFSNTADDTTRTEGARKSANLLFNPSTGALTAPLFNGKLDWSNINNKPDTFTPEQHTHTTNEIVGLLGYTKAESPEDLVTTDTLNVALGKLEYKADTVYTWYRSVTDTDTDNIINKWGEIVDFLNGVPDTTLNGILANFVKDLETTGEGNAVTDVSKVGNKITVTKGNSFLPLSGGTVNGWVNIRNTKSTEGTLQICTGSSSSKPRIRFEGDVSWGYLGFASANKPCYYDNSLNEYILWHSGNDGAGSGLDADTLDGVHLNPRSDTPFGMIPMVRLDGVMEVGRYLDFHYDNTSNNDYDCRLTVRGNYKNYIYLPSKSGTLALTTDIAESANKLQTGRYIWGQSFDGTADVSGQLTGANAVVSNTTDGYFIGNRKDGAATSDGGLMLYTYGSTPMSFYTKKTERMRITSDGKIGIGTITPEFTLSVIGTVGIDSGASGEKNAPLTLMKNGLGDYLFIKNNDSFTNTYIRGSLSFPNRSVANGLGWHVFPLASQFTNILGNTGSSYNLDSATVTFGLWNEAHVYIDSRNDRVGIKTVKPNYNLDVRGSIYGEGIVCNALTFYTRGTGTYTRAWITAKDSAGDFIIEAPLTTDSSSGTRAPITLTWRGGYPSMGGLKITGYSEAVLGGNKIWHAGNDGSGSGLDADLLDGKHASAFATSDHNHDSSYVRYAKVTKSTADSTNAKPYIYNVESETVISGYYGYWYILNLGLYSGGNFGTLLAMPYQDSLTDSELFIRSAKSGSWRTWRRVLHDGNSAVTKSGLTLTVTINGTSQSLTNSTYNFSGVSFTSGNLNTAEHDANNITSNGHWYYTSNGPSTSIGADTTDGALYSLAYSTSWVAQIALSYRDGDLFTRGKKNGTWTAWKQVAYALDFIKKSGDTLSSSTSQIQRAGSSVLWYLGRSNAMIKINSYSGYNAIASMKTTNGDWSLGVYENNVLYFTYITDTNFNAGTNTTTALIYMNPSGNVYATHFYEHSDINLKTNIENITTSDNIPLLKSFDWKSDGSHSYGLIALELEELGYSELVSDEGGLKTVKYSAALSLIVGKLQVKIKELEKEIEILKNKN